MLRKKLNAFTSQVHKEMKPGNKRLYFEDAWSLKANLKQYKVNSFGDGSTRILTTGREINEEVIDGLPHVRFSAFVQDRLEEGKKSFFKPICKARLKNGNEKKKKISKSLTVLKVVGLLGNKAEKLAETFKYPMYL